MPDLDEIEEEPTDEQLDSWARDVENMMSKCSYGQPYEDGEPVWLNQHGTLADALEMADVPEEHYEEVADRVRCPCCGNSCELYDEVGLKSEQELRFEELHAQWIEEHQHRLDDFYAHLEKYPYLGLAHELGREINESMKVLPKLMLTDCSWFRARPVRDGRNLTVEEFGLPDPEKIPIPEGRFNHHGQAVVYMAETAECAATEVLQEDESRAWVMKFGLKDLGPILNLSMSEEWADEGLPVLAVGLGYFRNLSRTVKRERGWKPEYLLPRFIADCARLNGFTGVIFRSSRYWADNLVLFGWDDQRIEPDGQPRIVEVASWKAPKSEPDPLGFLWIAKPFDDDAAPEPEPV